MAKKVYRVIVEASSVDYPNKYELRVAGIIAQHFKQDVIFIRRGRGKTADLNVAGVIWEIKSPRGNSKNTIKNNISEASKQSKRIIIDLSRSKISFLEARSRSLHHLKTYSRNILEVIIITRRGDVVKIYEKQKRGCA